MTTSSKKRTHTYIVTCDLPFPLHVGRRTYRLKLDGHRFGLKFDLVRREDFDERLEIQKTTMDLARDRRGFISYSRVKLTLPARAVFQFKRVPPGRHSTDQLLSSSTNEAIELARRVLNRFIDCYRDESNSFWIRPIQREELFRLQVEWTDSHGVTNFAKVFGFPAGGIGPRRTATKAFNDRLAKRVASDEDVPTHRILLLDAKDALDRGETHLAVFQAFASVEVAVRQIMRVWIRANAIPFPKSWPLVSQTKRRGAETVDDAVDWGNVDHMLISGLNGIGLAAPDSDGPEWQDWQRCRRLRNLISHKGFVPSEADARRCVRAAERLLSDYLNAHFGALPKLDSVRESTLAIDEILGGTTSSDLATYVGEILSRRPFRLGFRAIATQPSTHQRQGPMTWEMVGETVTVWIDTSLGAPAKESLVARLLTLLDLRAYGYPYAVVSDSVPWPDALYAYDLAAESLTLSVLDLAVGNKLSTAGLSVPGLFDEVADRSIDATLQPGFADSVSDLLDTYPVRAARICALSSTRRKILLASLDQVAPRQAMFVRRILVWLDALTGWDRNDCLRAMVGVHDETMMLASVLVFDPYAETSYGRGGGASLPGLGRPAT